MKNNKVLLIFILSCLCSGMSDDLKIYSLDDESFADIPINEFVSL